MWSRVEKKWHFRLPSLLEEACARPCKLFPFIQGAYWLYIGNIYRAEKGP